MRDEIDKILIKVFRKEISECHAADELCDLFRDAPRFSVSLVYVKNTPQGQEISLRCFITDALNKEEALGKALVYHADEMNGFNLSNKVILPANQA